MRWRGIPQKRGKKAACSFFPTSSHTMFTGAPTSKFISLGRQQAPLSRDEALRRAAAERACREAQRKSQDAATALQALFRGFRARSSLRTTNLAQLERQLHDFDRVAAIVAAAGKPFQPPLPRVLPLLALFGSGGAAACARGPRAAALAAAILRVIAPPSQAAPPPLCALGAAEPARYAAVVACFAGALLRALREGGESSAEVAVVAAALLRSLVDPGMLLVAGAAQGPRAAAELGARTARLLAASSPFAEALVAMRATAEARLRGGAGGGGVEQQGAGYGEQPLAGALVCVALRAACVEEDWAEEGMSAVCGGGSSISSSATPV